MRPSLLWLTLAFLVWIPTVQAADPTADGPFSHRGYYLTLTRTPTFGLEAWKKTIDAVRTDGGNLVILWTAGGFKSKKFPTTWGHNTDHENIKADFVRELIDYAHSWRIKVLLGFTPFGYDGVNRMALDRPEWAATGPGSCTLPPPAFMGIASGEPPRLKQGQNRSATLLNRHSSPRQALHFSIGVYRKHGSLSSDPLTEVRAGWWETKAGPFVYVVMVAQPTPDGPVRAAAGTALNKAAARLTELLVAAGRGALDP